MNSRRVALMVIFGSSTTRAEVCVNGPGAGTRSNQEDQRAEHSKIGARIADHEPKTLVRAGEFRQFRGDDGRRDDDEKRNRGGAGVNTEEYGRTAENFEDADEVRGEGRMREADSREACDPHVQVDEFEDALGQEDESNGQADEEGGGRAGGGLEEKAEERVHGREIELWTEKGLKHDALRTGNAARSPLQSIGWVGKARESGTG